MQTHSAVLIVTKRLKLRPFREEDWTAVHEYATDPEISKYQPWGPNSIKDTKMFVSKCIESSKKPDGNDLFFSIALLSNDQHIGGCVLTIDPENRGSASIGYTIGRRYWRMGYATEAAGALLDFAFADLGLREITSNCDASNEASRRVMEKIGMRLKKKDMNSRYFKNCWRNWLDYSIAAEEWHLRTASS